LKGLIPSEIPIPFAAIKRSPERMPPNRALLEGKTHELRRIIQDVA
jgi:hypothetical protein